MALFEEMEDIRASIVELDDGSSITRITKGNVIISEKPTDSSEIRGKRKSLLWQPESPGSDRTFKKNTRKM